MGILDAAMNLLTFGGWANRGAAMPAARAGWDALELKAAGGRPAYDPVPVLNAGDRWAWGDDSGVQELVRESFRIAGTVFRAGTLIADAFAEAPLRVYQEADGQPQEQPAHPLRALFAEPNPEQGEAEFWNTVVLIAFVNGYALVEQVRDRAGETVMLYPRTPESLKRVRLPGGDYAWEQRDARGGLVRRLADEDVFHVPYQFDPAMRRRGVSPVAVLGREIGIDVTLTAYLKAFIEEGGVPPFVATSKDPFSDPAQPDALRVAWGQKFGRGGAWSTVPFLAGVELEKVGLNFDEMAFPDLKGITELRIAQALGVPAHLLGAKEAIQNGGLSTTEMEQAMAFFQLYTIGPLRNRVDAAFTRAVLRAREPDRRWSLEFDTKRIRALQEDENQKAERVRANLSAGAITLEEARPELGVPAEANAGETFLRPFSVVEVVAGAEPEPTPPANPPKAEKAERRYRDAKALSPAEAELRTKSVDRNRAAQKKLASLGTRVLRKFWREQGQRLAEAVAKSEGADLATKALEAVDWRAEERALAAVLEQFYAKAGELAFADASELLGVGIDWSLANPNIQHTMRLLGKRIAGIAQTTQDDVARIVADGLSEGVTLETLADRIREELGGDSYRNRSLAVARTESQVSYNTASVLSYEQSGIVDELELFDNADHTEDYGASDGLSCSERNGLQVPLHDAQKHIDAEHPNGSLACAAVVALGGE